jgi:spore germination protein KC
MPLNKFGILLLTAFIVPCLTGCWNRIEVNDIAIVSAMGVDKIEESDIRLSIQVGIPSKLGPSAAGGGGDKEDSTFVVSETGETISDAFRKLQEKISRRIFFSHSRVLIIGEKLAKEGILHVVDFFARYQDPRLNSYMMCTKGEASELLKSKSLLEKVPSEETRELTKQGIGIKVSIKDIWDMMLAEGIEPVAPQFRLEPMEKTKKNESETETSSSQKTQAITGAAVFKKDRLVGWMNDMETRGILYLRNEMTTGIITVNLPKEKGGGKISVKIINVQSDIKPKLQGGNLTMDVNIRSETTVLENASKMNLSNSKSLSFLQIKLEEQIRNRVQLALDKVQKQFKSDIFGFGRAVYKTYPKEWNRRYKKSWDQAFPELEVTIKPNVIIRRIGLTKETRG